MTEEPKRRGRPAKADKTPEAPADPVSVDTSLPKLDDYKVASPRAGIEVRLLRKYVPEAYLQDGAWVENVCTKDTIKLFTVPAGEVVQLRPDEATRAIQHGIATTTANSFNG